MPNRESQTIIASFTLELQRRQLDDLESLRVLYGDDPESIAADLDRLFMGYLDSDLHHDVDPSKASDLYGIVRKAKSLLTALATA